jgi:hypothetical protein
LREAEEDPGFRGTEMKKPVIRSLRREKRPGRFRKPDDRKKAVFGETAPS